RPPTQEELDRIATSLLDALELLHGANFLHRDIAPDNILIRTDGTPVLLDFGAARRAVGEMSRSLTGIVKAGYSPQEQYATDGRLQGPWSDLYAFGATLYRAVAGEVPEEATLRVSDDRMQPAVQAAKGSYRPNFLASIDACLRPKFADRPQSVAELRPILLDEGGRENERLAHGGATRRIGAAKDYQAHKRRWIVTAALVAVMGGGYAGLEYTRWAAHQSQKPEIERARLEGPAKAGPQPDQSQRTPGSQQGCYMIRVREGCVANSACEWVPTQQNGYCRTAATQAQPPSGNPPNPLKPGRESIPPVGCTMTRSKPECAANSLCAWVPTEQNGYCRWK